MKKILVCLLTLCLLFAMVACSSETPSKAASKMDGISKVVNEAVEKQSKENKGDKTPTETQIVEVEETQSVETEPTETEPVVEEVEMGEVPDVINLSTLEVGKTYVFTTDNVLPEDTEESEFSLLNVHPQLVNDTEHTVVNAILQINDEEPENFAAYKHTGYTYVPLANAIIDKKEVKTLRITVQLVEIEEVLDPEQTVYLSDCELNVPIEMGTKNYLFNNTESIITVKSDEDTYELQPYDVLESSFTYVNQIVNINFNEGVG